MTRREAREAYTARTDASRLDAFVKKPQPAAAAAAPAKPKRRLRGFASIGALIVAAGIVSTVAIPAYAFNPAAHGQSGQFGSSAVDTMKKKNSQSVDVADTVGTPGLGRDGYVSAVDQVAVAAAQAAAYRQTTTQLASYGKAYDGPTAADYLKNPPYPDFSLSQVVSVAKKYIGTPYVFGGATPAGFDCSGFVMFVYAQFGIALPHSSSAQGHIGQTVSLDQAQPGDVIALNNGSHDGFYAGRDAAGNVLILDAPKPGGHVGVRTLWTTAYHIQHYGIPG